jgi:hypothetical protein
MICTVQHALDYCPAFAITACMDCMDSMYLHTICRLSCRVRPLQYGHPKIPIPSPDMAIDQSINRSIATPSLPTYCPVPTYLPNLSGFVHPSSPVQS